jgi:CubicO group peptidase (beta-lactamase class C family)
MHRLHVESTSNFSQPGNPRNHSGDTLVRISRQRANTLHPHRREFADAIVEKEFLALCGSLPALCLKGEKVTSPRSSLVLPLVLGFLSANAQQPSIPRPDGSRIAPSQIDSTVTELMTSAHVTGAGIAIFHNRNIAYLHAYGLRDTEKNLPLTPDSVMTSASLSKPAFAILVMRLVQEHVLDLDKPIAAYLPKPLPDYPGYTDLLGDDRWRKLTLRILLSHTTGFANYRGLEDDHKLKFHFDPGTRYGYSGEGIQLAQFVVESATGKSLTDLMQENLYRPLGMTRTSMIWEPRFESDFANGYDEYGRSLGPERRSAPAAAGSMQTTLRDYATLLSALLRSKPLGIPATGSLFNRQIAIHSAHQFPSLAPETTTANDAIGLSYGLGWGLYFSPYGKAFFKEGHDEGWRHLALCFRQHGDGILILTNSSNGEGIFKPLIDSIMGATSFPFDWEGYTPWNLLPPLPKLKEHKRVVLTPEQLERLTGRYALSADIVLTVTAENGRLYVQENDEPKQEYLPESPQDFYSVNSSDECSFKPVEGSQAQVLVMHVDGKDIDLKRLN